MLFLLIDRCHAIAKDSTALSRIALFIVTFLLAVGQSLAEAPPTADRGELATPYGVVLPRTDGDGLAPKPPALSQEENQQWFAEGQRACAGPCVSPFGTVLGVAQGAEGRSNCISTCIRPEYSFLNLKTGVVSVHPKNPEQEALRYIGVTYQCVEYARKWWMKNRDITFGDVDAAYDILYLSEASNIRTGAAVPLARSVNGSARRAPQAGDLVIYYPDRADPDWRYGHVAVVVAVDLEKGQVALAEQNYDNQPWQQPQKFARQIQLFEIGGRYTLLDAPIHQHRHTDGGRIAGWIYPVGS